ncbi:hypothetical protein [Aureimonas glaciei]|uniref:Uncharacterized protein n=1 Tax=Aureimonas glaciei TaxID=1776957 RepID=A0A917DCJ1_9HYPH|nr:hypothetical protein [Aureimonas glaciei]GGD28867.1 hypothetical protein GCM10011335_35040 [Aureimonas glaciei]
MIRLVVSNPDLVPPPPISSDTLRKMARLRIENAYVRKHMFDRTIAIEPDNYANLTIYPESSTSGLWMMSQSITIDGYRDAADHANVYSSKLAAFDHGVARIRRACAAAAPEHAEIAAEIRKWAETLEMPL